MEQMNKLHLLSRIPEEISGYSNPSQEQLPMYNSAASLIKKHWHEYKRKQIMNYYTNMFQRNSSGIFQPEEEVSDIMDDQDEADGEFA